MNDERVDQLLGNPFAQMLMAGRVGFRLGTAARTDAAGNGEVHFYVSGSTIVMQMYDAEAGAWRATTLS